MIDGANARAAPAPPPRPAPAGPESEAVLLFPLPCHTQPDDEPSAPRPLARRPIGQAVSQVFGVDLADLERDTRGRAEVALARQVAMYLAHVTCGLTLTDTGRMFSRDRTTVAHACAVIEDRRDDPTFDRALELLELVVRAIALPRAIAAPPAGGARRDL